MPAQPPKKSGSGVLVGVIIGIIALVLLCGGGGAAVWFFVLDDGDSTDAEVLTYHDAVDSCDEFTKAEYTGAYGDLFGGPYLRSETHNAGNDTSRIDCGFTSNDPDEDLHLDSMGLEVATTNSSKRAADWIETRRTDHEERLPELERDGEYAVLVELDEPGQEAFYIADLLDSGRWTVYFLVQDANLNITVSIQTERPGVTEESLVDMLAAIVDGVIPVMKR